jgi:hypothetical protein
MLSSAFGIALTSGAHFCYRSLKNKSENKRVYIGLYWQCIVPFFPLNSVRLITLNSMYHMLCHYKLRILSQNVFICFLWFPELRPIISPNSFNGFIFKIGTQFVFCEVRTEVLNTADMSFMLQRVDWN